MHELEKLNAGLTAEADRILHEHGLLKICEKYGRPFVTGSYALGLMARRDLDFNIETENISVAGMFRLGGELAASLKMRRVLYLNEFVDRHPRLPLGLYVGGYTRVLGADKEWCLDIWAMDAAQSRVNQDYISSLRAALSQEKKLLILDIKRQCLLKPGYQHHYFSVDIYKAVMENVVSNAAEFFVWVEKNLITDRSV